MVRVAWSISGSQRGCWAVPNQERGSLKWYILIDRGARDSVCEWNSKKSPQDEGREEGVKARERGVWWSGGTEPENCIACSVISLPPGSHSVSLPSSHSPGFFSTSTCSFFFLPCVFVSPLFISFFRSPCRYITLSPPPPLCHFLGGYHHCLSSPSIPSCVLTWLSPPFLNYLHRLINA